MLFDTGAQTFLPQPVPLVFVAYGIVAPEYDYNDYQQADVADRIVVFLAGEPPSSDPDFFDGPRATVYSDPEMKFRIALARGARGAILLPSPRERAHLVWERVLGWASGPLFLIGFGLSLLALVRRRPPLLGPAAALALAGILAFAASGHARLSDEHAAELVGGLLHNVYRAFDFRDGERIYDTLAQSVAGDLLEQIYLETRRGLELQSQGGARAKVKEVALDALETAPAEDGAFTARATWQVSGSVGHWGHLHQRRNHYRADLTVAPVDGSWRLTRVEILEEERL